MERQDETLEEKVERNFQPYVFGPIPAWEKPKQERHEYKNEICQSLLRLIGVVRTLRGPEGCPWDKEQTHASLAPCMIEEVYEAKEAADLSDAENLKEELGDLLFLIVSQTTIAEETGEFTLEEVFANAADKMIYRHPKIFGDDNKSRDTTFSWEELKQKEKREKSAGEGLVRIPKALPAMLRAQKVYKKAQAAVGKKTYYLRRFAENF